METLKKFNRNSMRNAITLAIRNMSDEEAYTTCAGVYNLFKIMSEYYQYRYGSPKRMDDLVEYIHTIQCAYLKKVKK